MAETVPGMRKVGEIRTDRTVKRISWSPDGEALAIVTSAHVVLVNGDEMRAVQEVSSLLGNNFECAAWSPDGSFLAVGGWRSGRAPYSGWVGVLDRGGRWRTGPWSPPARGCFGVAWTTEGTIVSTDPFKSGSVQIHTMAGKLLRDRRLTSGASAIAVAEDWVAVDDGAELHVLDRGTLAERNRLPGCVGTNDIAYIANIRAFVVARRHGLVSVIQLETGLVHELEHHAGHVRGLSLDREGRIFASLGDDALALWSVGDWNLLGSLPRHAKAGSLGGVAFHPERELLAFRGKHNRSVELWEYDSDTLLSLKPRAHTAYTTARIALVGDSQVGKTHLGHRIATGEWRAYPSTHGQQFWVVDDLGATRADGVRCEAVLWDFAGQPDYRLLHSLFLEELDVALLLFDAAERTQPLKGVEFWLRQLGATNGACTTILVAAKIDRGTPDLTEAELASWCRKNGILGYVPTSAERDDGVRELKARIRDAIDWDKRTATVSPATFKRVKDFVLGLRAATSQTATPERPTLLLRPPELRAHLEASDPAWLFTDAEMVTAVRHLASHGLVRELSSAAGEPVVLLAPDLLVNLAGSIILAARRNPHGLGAIDEGQLLAGALPLPELEPLVPADRALLLDAAVALFVRKAVCVRESDEPGTFLIFPSLIHQKRPSLAEDAPLVDDVSFRVTGAVEGVYPALVVLLGYTQQVRRRNQWQDEARYELGGGEVCGFRAVHEGEGSLDLVLRYAPNVPDQARRFFEGLFWRLLSRRRGLTVVRFAPVDCACGERVQRERVMAARRDLKAFLRCDRCDTQIFLHAAPLPEDSLAVARGTARADARARYEAALVALKRRVSELQPATNPTCFLAYASGDRARERWVETLAADLKNAGVRAILDQWHGRPGDSLTTFLDQLSTSDFVAVVCTPELVARYVDANTNYVVAEELRRIGARLRGRRPVLPLLRAGTRPSSLPPVLEDTNHSDFRNDDGYFVALVDLLAVLFKLPADDPGVRRVRADVGPDIDR